MEKKLSIVCITYNQKEFIKQALDGFINQKTEFPFVVYIGDDCSTDGTAEIIKEYSEKYPDIIVPILRNSNIGAIPNFIDTLSRAKTKYVALCEGDDYWTDENKLQKQVDFLEVHPEYSGCFHPVKIHWENGEKKDSVYPKPEKMRGKKFVTLDDLIKYNYIQTNSIVYRWAFSDKDIKEYFPDKILPGDLYLHLLHAKTGNIAYLPDVMAVYRRQEGGIWFDSANKILKYGLEITKFYYSIWKNFTDSSEKYLQEIFLPVLKEVSDTYYKNGNIEELKILKDSYGDLYTKVASSAETNSSKSKKYMKLFSIFLIVSALELIAIIALLLKFKVF